MNRFIIKPGKKFWILVVILSITFIFIDKITLIKLFIVILVGGASYTLFIKYILRVYVFGPPHTTSEPQHISKIYELFCYWRQKNENSSNAQTCKMADLGSGKGEIIIYFAKKGIEAHGYEISIILYLYSLFKIKYLGLEKLAKVHYKSFWEVDLSQYSLITVYGIGYIMEKIETKLDAEMRQHTAVLTNYFMLPNKIPMQTEDEIYLYEF